MTLTRNRRTVITFDPIRCDMGDMFREFGRRVEQFKQDMDAAAVENADYRCSECGAQFAVHHERCPDCGAAELVPMNTDDDGA
jgi:rubrerythrin